MKKLSFQKIFCFLSFLFIFSCCVFYGTRFVKLYIENEKEKEIEKNSLVKIIKNGNEENANFINIDNETYFVNDSENNYLLYSSILWRIIKIKEDNSIVAISNNALTSLAYGKELDYLTSNINKWLNNTSDESKGILENQLNDISTYLQKTSTCLDKVDTINNSQCVNVTEDYYFSLLSTMDFANIGNKKSYAINNEYFYLNNANNDQKIWYITDEGKLTLSDGSDIIGIRPVITIKSNIDYVDGDGSKNNPYTIEKENGLFGSYVKLGEDIWRIYEVNDDFLRLMKNDYIKNNDTTVTHIYSSNTSYHNDTAYGSLAYYLNNNYYNSLPYKNLIIERKWSNGYYNNKNNYDYNSSLDSQVDTKIATMSIGNIFLNPELENYFTMTSISERGSVMYTIPASKKTYTKGIQSKTNIVPTITIDRNILKKGDGTITSPYETE